MNQFSQIFDTKAFNMSRIFFFFLNSILNSEYSACFVCVHYDYWAKFVEKECIMAMLTLYALLFIYYLCAIYKSIHLLQPFVIVLVVDSQHHLIFHVCYKTKGILIYFHYIRNPSPESDGETKNLTTEKNPFWSRNCSWDESFNLVESLSA